MNSGNQLSTMTARPPASARPAISMRPPMSIADGVKALEKVDTLTEEPARQAAAALGTSSIPGAEGKGGMVASNPVKKAAPVRADKMPWEEVDDGIKSVTFRVPAVLAAKLKYLGGVTYGESINSIAITALEREVKRMMKERGHGQQGAEPSGVPSSSD